MPAPTRRGAMDKLEEARELIKDRQLYGYLYSDDEDDD